MGGSRQMKRVTWASDLNLCQVKLFLSEDSPFEVGIGTQDHLQAKTAGSVPPGIIGSDDNLPPGFEGLQQANAWKSKISRIPLVQWKFPARFEVNTAWQVIAGEESTEVEVQNQREMRVLEAIYPRPSAIPSNPSALDSMEPGNLNQFTPVVPITPIEEEDASVEVGFSSAGSSFMSSQTTYLPHQNLSSPHSASTPPTVLQSDIVAAAQAAVASIVSNSDQGNLIDPELLIKILRDPKMIEHLVANQGPTSNSQSFPSSNLQNVSSSSSTFHSMPVVGPQGFASTSKQHIPPPSVQGIPAIGTQIASSGLPSMPSTKKQYVPSLRPRPVDPQASVSGHVTTPEIFVPATTGAAPFYPQPRVGVIPNLRPATAEMVSTAASSMGAPGTKDSNYYKSLIQQHGGERRDATAHFPHQSYQTSMTNQEQLNAGKSRDSKQKIMKPCIYFNSARGCRNGANCAFQHDLSSQIRVGTVQEIQSTKRMKLDREITGS